MKQTSTNISQQRQQDSTSTRLKTNSYSSFITDNINNNNTSDSKSINVVSLSSSSSPSSSSQQGPSSSSTKPDQSSPQSSSSPKSSSQQRSSNPSNGSAPAASNSSPREGQSSDSSPGSSSYQLRQRHQSSNHQPHHKRKFQHQHRKEDKESSSSNNQASTSSALKSFSISAILETKAEPVQPQHTLGSSVPNFESLFLESPLLRSASSSSGIGHSFSSLNHHPHWHQTQQHFQPLHFNPFLMAPFSAVNPAYRPPIIPPVLGHPFLPSLNFPPHFHPLTLLQHQQHLSQNMMMFHGHQSSHQPGRGGKSKSSRSSYRRRSNKQGHHAANALHHHSAPDFRQGSEDLMSNITFQQPPSHHSNMVFAMSPSNTADGLIFFENQKRILQQAMMAENGNSNQQSKTDNDARQQKEISALDADEDVDDLQAATTSGRLTSTSSSKGQSRRNVTHRSVFTERQRLWLERAFDLGMYIGRSDRKKLADGLGMKESQVKIWFQNRRMKQRHATEGSQSTKNCTTPIVPSSTQEGQTLMEIMTKIGEQRNNEDAAETSELANNELHRTVGGVCD